MASPSPSRLTVPVWEQRPLTGDALAAYHERVELRRAERAARAVAAAEAAAAEAAAAEEAAAAAEAAEKAEKAAMIEAGTAAEGTAMVVEAAGPAQAAVARGPSGPLARLATLRHKAAGAGGRQPLLGGPVSRYPML
eukprot:2993826-Prymnesium_polylepis.1